MLHLKDFEFVNHSLQSSLLSAFIRMTGIYKCLKMIEESCADIDNV